LYIYAAGKSKTNLKKLESLMCGTNSTPSSVMLRQSNDLSNT